jgi:hypothetical protein
VTKFKAFSQNLPEGIVENMKYFSHGIRFPGRGSNHAHLNTNKKRHRLSQHALSWKGFSISVLQEIPLSVMKTEGSSPCSQEPVTGPYPEPTKFRPHRPLSSMYVLSLLSLLLKN